MADADSMESGAVLSDDEPGVRSGGGTGAETPPTGGGQRGTRDGKAEAGTPQAPAEELKTADSPAPPDPETFNLTMPEGYGAAERAEFVKIARNLGLSEEQTQKLAEHSAAARATTLDAQRAARNRQVDDWNKALREDKDFGGEKFAENVEYFKAGVKHLDESGELTALLEETGYGSHPAVVRAVARIGRQLNGDRIIGRGVTANDRQLAERYFNK